MYYDRRLPPELLVLLLPGGPVSWMVELVCSTWGVENRAHIQFRKAAGRRKFGGIQLYLGQTSPLEIRGHAKGHVELAADAFYRKVTPALFGRKIPVAELLMRRRELEMHVKKTARVANRRFLDGEAVSHAGMMRRYGIGHQQQDPFLAVDSEVRCGFGSSAKRASFEAELTRELRLNGKEEDLPRKLDAIGILAGGDIGLVEVKRNRGDLARAVVQVAAHVATFRQLDGPDLVAVLRGMISDKVAVALLPDMPEIRSKPHLVPIVAAPDAREDWLAVWKRETQSVRDAHPDFLQGLRFWNLSPTGELREEQHP